MPVNTYPGANLYAANGVATVFAYSFRILDEDDLEVKVDGVLKLLTTDYTVSGVGDANGGNVTFLVPPANGLQVQIARVRPYKRTEYDYQRNGSFDEETVDADLDSIVMMVQQLSAAVARAFKAPVSVNTDQVSSDADWAARASRLLGFDAEGALQLQAPINVALTVVPAWVVGLPINAKGDIIVGTAANAATRKAVGTDGYVLMAASGQADGLIWQEAQQYRNRLINGSFWIDQNKEGGVYTTAGAGLQTVDQWSATDSGGVGRITVQREVDPDHAQEFNLKVGVNTIDAAIGAADLYVFYTAIEGSMVADLAMGTAGAKTITLSFEVKSSVAGDFGVYLQNSAANRFYASKFTVNVANVVEKKSITIPLDQAGAWLSDTGVGIYIGFVLAGGANFQGALGAWGAAQILCPATQANFMSNGANVMRIKRVQFELGSAPTPFQRPSYAEELKLCQRYYAKTFPQGTAVAQNAGVAGAVNTQNVLAGAQQYVYNWRYPVAMRASPTLTGYCTSAASANWYNNSTAAQSNAISFTYSGASGTTIYGNAAAGDAAGNNLTAHATASARIA